MRHVEVKWVAFPLYIIDIDRNFDSPMAFIYDAPRPWISALGGQGS